LVAAWSFARHAGQPSNARHEQHTHPDAAHG
jgi:hypothetical protein